MIDPFDIAIGFRLVSTAAVQTQHFDAGFICKLLRKTRILRAIDKQLRLLLFDHLH